MLFSSENFAFHIKLTYSCSYCVYQIEIVLLFLMCRVKIWVLKTPTSISRMSEWFDTFLHFEFHSWAPSYTVS